MIGFYIGGGFALMLVADHPFLNDHDPSDFNALLVMLARVTNSRYHASAARDARERIVTFFDHHLRGARR